MTGGEFRTENPYFRPITLGYMGLFAQILPGVPPPLAWSQLGSLKMARHPSREARPVIPAVRTTHPTKSAP